MKRVKAKYRKPFTGHAIGYCRGCEKEFDIFHDGIQEVRNHILKTGHSVDVEYGCHNTFYLVD